MSAKHYGPGLVLLVLFTACATSGPHAPVPITAPSRHVKTPEVHRQAQTSAETPAEQAGKVERPAIRPTPAVPPSAVENNPLVQQGPGAREPALPDVLPPGIMRAYQEFRYDEVISLAEQILLDPKASPGQQVRALVLAGAAWHLKGRPTNAAEAFHEALAREPSIRLNENVFPMEILRLFEEARNKAQNSMVPVQPPGREIAHISQCASLYKQGQTLKGDQP